MGKVLRLRSVGLLPRGAVRGGTGACVQFSSPKLHVNKLGQVPRELSQGVQMTSFQMSSPSIRIYESSKDNVSTSLGNLTLRKIS